jgi:hypothetical protein
MYRTKLSRCPDGAAPRRRLLGRAAVGMAAGAMLAATIAVPAGAALTETGPIDPSHGYPSWYSDGGNAAAGLGPLQLELCLDGPLCLATDFRPDPSKPVSFPDNFPDEAFWWAGEASIDSGNTSALLTLAQEAAFVNELPAAGDQVAFTRMRIRIDGLTANASYTITHPYGAIVLTADATGGINYTNDFGCFDTPCSQQAFERAANGFIGPFLRWTSGAPEGYVGDPNVEHAVVGSPTGNNFFQVEGPGISPLRTDLFSIQGKMALSSPTTPPTTPPPTTPPTPAPVLKYPLYKIVHDSTIFEMVPDSGGTEIPQQLSYEKWRDVYNFQTPTPATTDFVKYPWSPTLYAVTYWPGGENHWMWTRLSYVQWQTAGYPTPRNAGWIKDSYYYQWGTSDELFVEGADGVNHQLTGAEWEASGYRSYDARSNEGYLKLTWAPEIARMSNLTAGAGRPMDYNEWQNEAFPTPKVVQRVAGDGFYQINGSSTVWYQGPGMERPVTYSEWTAAGSPPPSLRSAATVG